MEDYKDPVIEEYKKHLDLTLIDQSLQMTFEERMDRLVAMAKLKDEMEAAGKRAREQRRRERKGE